MDFQTGRLQGIDSDHIIQPGNAYLVPTGGKSIWMGIACDKDMEEKARVEFIRGVNPQFVEGRFLFFLPARDDNFRWVPCDRISYLNENLTNGVNVAEDLAATVVIDDTKAFQSALEAWKLSCAEGNRLGFWRQVLGLPAQKAFEKDRDDDYSVAFSLSRQENADHSDEVFARNCQAKFDHEFAQYLDKRSQSDKGRFKEFGSSQEIINSLSKKRKLGSEVTKAKSKQEATKNPKTVHKWNGKPNPLETEESDTEVLSVSSGEEDNFPSIKRIRANAAFEDIRKQLGLGQSQAWRNISELTNHVEPSLSSKPEEDEDFEGSSPGSDSTGSDDDFGSDSSSRSNSKNTSGFSDNVSINSSLSSPPGTDEIIYLDVKPTPKSSIDGNHPNGDSVAVMVGSKVFSIAASQLKEHSSVLSDMVEERDGRQVIDNKLLTNVCPSEFSAIEQFLASGEFSPVLVQDPYKGAEDFIIPTTSFKPTDRSRFVTYRLLDVDPADTNRSEAALLRLGQLLSLGLELCIPPFVDLVLEKLQYGFPGGYHHLSILVLTRQVYQDINKIQNRQVSKFKEWVSTILKSKQTELATDEGVIGEIYWEVVDSNPDLEKRLRGGRATQDLSTIS